MQQKYLGTDRRIVYRPSGGAGGIINVSSESKLKTYHF
jgi:hypothetical protein